MGGSRPSPSKMTTRPAMKFLMSFEGKREGRAANRGDEGASVCVVDDDGGGGVGEGERGGRRRQHAHAHVRVLADWRHLPHSFTASKTIHSNVICAALQGQFSPLFTYCMLHKPSMLPRYFFAKN